MFIDKYRYDILNKFQRICRHIAKAPRTNAKTKALLSKSLQSDPIKKEIFNNALPHMEKTK